jgi:two-component system sensor histidine kinase NreB
VTRPPIRSGSFWVVQALILGVVLGHLSIDLSGVSLPLGIPNFATVGLFLVPIIYATLNFGIAGSGASAAWATLLMLPDLLLVDSPTELWADGTMLAMIDVVALVVGQRMERQVAAGQRTEVALSVARAAEARYRALFETSFAPVLVVDSKGVLRETNPAAGKLFGARLSRRRLHDLLGGRAADAVLAQTPPRFLLIRSAEGDSRMLHAFTTPVPNPTGEPMFQIVLQDVTDELEQEQRTREYAGRLLSGQEEERRRIQRGIHDEPLQTLLYVRGQLKTVSETSGLDVSARSNLNRIVEIMTDVVDQLMKLARGLRPFTLDDLGLVPSLRRLVSDFTLRTGVEAQLGLRGAERDLASEIATAFFRVGQEALSNVERHAAAHRVSVDLVFGRRELHLRVKDDGIGFLASQPVASLGLLSMQERAAQLGGRLELESRPSEGTRLHLVIPTGRTARPFVAPFAISQGGDPNKTPRPAIKRRS